MSDKPDVVDDLLAFIDASPSPYHAVAETTRRLQQAGFVEKMEAAPWQLGIGDRFYVVRSGSVAAFHLGSGAAADAGFHLVGAHTDSPNLRVKPEADLSAAGCAQLAVEPYGGVLLHTWLDRDLSLAGRVAVAGGARPSLRLYDFVQPILRIPSLAVHLHRDVNKDGLVLNKQRHLPPVLALTDHGLDFRALLAERLDVGKDDILAWDLGCYETTPSTRSGLNGDFIHAPRLDNLASCHAALTALTDAAGSSAATRGVVFYDHEEVGSRSAQGAAGSFLRTLLGRIVEATGGEPGAQDLGRAISQSLLISADMAHALHPNYVSRHEPKHQPILGKGPVIKINSNQSYATDARTWAAFESWCRDVGVKPQRFVTRSDLGCGSTIGPATAAQLGIPTIDVGNPMLSMHSAREMAAAADVAPMIAVLRRFFES